MRAHDRRQLGDRRDRLPGSSPRPSTRGWPPLSARLKTDARPLMYRLLQDGGISEVAFGAEHWRVAVEAYLQYGKRRHPAQLNFGDCLSYATAKLAQMPLLCVGDDFPQTDLALA